MFKKNKLANTIIYSMAAGSISQSALSVGLEEIIVTATKRAENMQEIPVAIQALNGDTLDELGIETFDQYIQFLPNVTQAGRGPGQSEIYIRGAATEQIGRQAASIQGSAPSVALYLDEQPIAFGGRNLDIYAADLERIEVLAGPQGTLFGASSQAGTVRLITQKPVQGEFQVGVDLGFSSTAGGEFSNAVEAYFNVPITDKLAARIVVYNDNQGGWIDNKTTTRTTNAQTFIANNPAAAGGLTQDRISSANNATLAEDDFNDASYAGFRFGLSYDLNDDWNLLVQHNQQRLETEGVFDYDPGLGQGEDTNARFTPDKNSDEFGLTSWTLSGRLGALDVIYSGGYLDRDVDATIDYIGYAAGGAYATYYICTGTYTADIDCRTDPRMQFLDKTSNTRQTHEIRISSDADALVYGTAGLFFDISETTSEGEFTFAGADAAGFGPLGTIPGLAAAGGVPPAGVNNPNPRGPSTGFTNDFTREDEQIALFGEIGVNITDTVGVKLGARYYDIDHTLQGGIGSAFGCKGSGSTVCSGVNFSHDITGRLQALGSGTDAINAYGALPTTRGFSAPGVIEGIANGSFSVDGLGSDGVLNQSDTIIRLTLDWQMSESVLLFTTYSEGFRPPMTNRVSGRLSNSQAGPFQGYLTPAIAVTDELTNYELGLKGDFLDDTLRINATLYYSEITDLQTARFDPVNVGFTVFVENVGDAEVRGLDADFQWVVSENLLINGAIGLVDSELTRINPQLENVAVPVGSELPFTPDISANIRARYSFSMDSFGAEGYVQASVAYTGESKAGIIGNALATEAVTIETYGRPSGLKIEAEGGSFLGSSRSGIANARYVQESYVLMGLTAGFTKDNWGAELFIDNLTDENAQISITTNDFTPKVTTNRPGTLGMRLSYDF